ncbi:FAD:protein FMN transferase [Shewanella sp. A3A]|nr:FAD:protein FMN transferase [Shewanella ferrihydritica]
MSKLPRFKRFLLSCCTLVLLCGCGQSDEVKVRISGATMGTTYHITYIANPTSPSQTYLQTKIDNALDQVNQVASTYIVSSELSQLNQSQSTAPQQYSAALTEMLAEGIHLAQFTQGYLDITVGPLVNLWGFGPDHHPKFIPSAAMIAQAKQDVGAHFLALDGQSVRKLNPKVYVDLSTLAKGYGVDVVADTLAAEGIDNYLVEIGGEMRIAGHSLAQQDWRIAVEKPVAEQRQVQHVLQPKDSAVATAGDYRNFFDENNVRYSHIIDPNTGYPIHHHTVSVTVVGKSCMAADGLSTGLMVMGVEKGLALAEANNIAAMFITRNDDGSFSEHYSQAFQQYL